MSGLQNFEQKLTKPITTVELALKSHRIYLHEDANPKYTKTDKSAGNMPHSCMLSSEQRHIGKRGNPKNVIEDRGRWLICAQTWFGSPNMSAATCSELWFYGKTHYVEAAYVYKMSFLRITNKHRCLSRPHERKGKKIPRQSQFQMRSHLADGGS
jgi:hypothetical protein